MAELRIDLGRNFRLKNMFLCCILKLVKNKLKSRRSKMKKKNVLALILSTAMMISFASCGKNESQSTSTNMVDGKFVPQKDMEITVWSTHGTDYVQPTTQKDNVVEKWLQEQTRVTVKNAYGNGGGTWESMLARMIAGNNFPELVDCGSGQGVAQFKKLEEADMIYELTPEMLQRYAPDVWEKMPENMWEKIKIDGKIYGIPYYFPVDKEIDEQITDEEMEAFNGTVHTEIGQTLWIRDDIAKMLYPEAKTYDEIVAMSNEKNTSVGDELFDIPVNSTDDLVKLLRDIKALELTEDGKTVYSMGFSGKDCWSPFYMFGSVLKGYVGHDYICTWNTETEEIELPLLGETVKEVAKIENTLIREKVIDPESLLNTDAQFNEKLYNGLYAVTALPIYAPSLNANLEESGKSFRYRPLYTNIPAVEGMGITKKPVTWGNAVGILKSVDEKDVPQILNWINTQFTDEWEEVRYWGPESAGLYVDNQDGTRTFKDDRLNQRFIYNNEDSGIPEEECFGLSYNCGKYFIRFKQASGWAPQIYNHVKSYSYHTGSAFQISRSGKYAKEPVVAPPFELWDAAYADIELVNKFWLARSKWEDPFRLTLTAASEKEFESKWQSAVDNMKSIVNLGEMTKQMTERAKTLK